MGNTNGQGTSRHFGQPWWKLAPLVWLPILQECVKSKPVRTHTVWGHGDIRYMVFVPLLGSLSGCGSQNHWS